jgi:AhpD family alkylhydroperoxidase
LKNISGYSLILGMGKLIAEFNAYREKMNTRILDEKNLNINRFFNLDTTSYAAGALPVKTKEMLGLVSSMVLRCDDCIKYHLGKCKEEGVSSAEIWEIFMIANLVGGSIVIPHFRRAVEYWDELNEL